MARSIYGVFAGSKFALTQNKRVAVAAARKAKGEVRFLPIAGAYSSYDAPTFYVCSDPLPGADFRPPHHEFLRSLGRDLEEELARALLSSLRNGGAGADFVPGMRRGAA